MAEVAPLSGGGCVWTCFVRFAGGTGEQSGAQPSEEGQGCHAQRHVPMPSVSGPGLAVIKAEFALSGAEAGLDGPAQTRDAGQFGQAGLHGCEDDVVGAVLGIAPAASDQLVIPGRLLQAQQAHARPAI